MTILLGALIVGVTTLVNERISKNVTRLAQAGSVLQWMVMGYSLAVWAILIFLVGKGARALLGV